VSSHLYSKNISWSDVVINEVPLETSFKNEDFMDSLSQEKHSSEENYERHVIVVNSKENVVPKYSHDDYDINYERWVGRFKKMSLEPMTFRGSKRDPDKKDKYPVKPKKDSFIDRVDNNRNISEYLVDKGIPMDNNVMDIIPAENFNWEGRKYCPPIHWVNPVICWDLIWSHMDEIENGYKRGYHYIPPGEIEDGIKGPVIYFYDLDQCYMDPYDIEPVYGPDGDVDYRSFSSL